MLFRSSDENSCIFSYRNIYCSVKKNRNVNFFQYRTALVETYPERLGAVIVAKDGSTVVLSIVSIDFGGLCGLCP